MLGLGGGIGIFNVEGSQIDQIGIGSEGSGDGFWIQNSGSILRLRIDDIPPVLGGGIRPIDVVERGGGGGNVTFEAGALLDVDFLNEELEFGGTWTAMRWHGELTDNGLAFAEGVDTVIWSFEFDLENKALLIHSASEIDPVIPEDPGAEDGKWLADADGSWGDPANWVDGKVATGASRTADFATRDITGDRRVDLDIDRRIGQLLFGDTSGEFSWTLGPGALSAAVEQEDGLKIELVDFTAIPAVHIPAGSLARFERRIDGSQGFYKTGGGVLELTNPANPVSGDIVVAEGLLRATTGGADALGAQSTGNNNFIIVKDGATFQFGSAENMRTDTKTARLSGTGVSDGEGGTLGAFYSDVTGTGNQMRWSLTDPQDAFVLDADATIRIDGPFETADRMLFAHMNLNGHTLTKTGTAGLVFDRANSRMGQGLVHVKEGWIEAAGEIFRNGIDLIVDEGADVRGGRNWNWMSDTNTSTINGRMMVNYRTGTGTFENRLGILQGSGVIATGLRGFLGVTTLRINHRTEDSFFSGDVLPELSAGLLHLFKGNAGDEDNVSTLTLDGQIRHHGNTTVNAGNLVLGENSAYTFYIKGPGTTNRILGPSDGAGMPTLAVNGAFRFDLSEADTGMGTSWSPVDENNLTEVTLGESFRVAGFVEVEEGVWGANANGVGYQFTEATLTLQVVEEFEDIATGFQQWQSEFLPGQPENQQLPGADPDGDGVVNLLEYAFGGNPLHPSRAVLPSIQVVEENEEQFLEISFTRIDADDTVYQIEAADSLGGEFEVIWVSTDHSFTTGEETVRDTQPIGGTNARFLRVVVTLQ